MKWFECCDAAGSVVGECSCFWAFSLGAEGSGLVQEGGSWCEEKSLGGMKKVLANVVLSLASEGRFLVT